MASQLIFSSQHLMPMPMEYQQTQEPNRSTAAAQPPNIPHVWTAPTVRSCSVATEPLKAQRACLNRKTNSSRRHSPHPGCARDETSSWAKKVHLPDSARLQCPFLPGPSHEAIAPAGSDPTIPSRHAPCDLRSGARDRCTRPGRGMKVKQASPRKWNGSRFLRRLREKESTFFFC